MDVYIVMVKKSPDQNQSPREKAQPLDFPRHTLEQALRVAQAIESKNGGQPLPPTETAIAIGVSPGSSSFRDLLSSSFKYGLSTGSFRADRVALTALAEQIVRPRSDAERNQAMATAALNPRSFQAIYDYYKGKKLPEDQFFRNTLVRDFEIPAEHAGLCAELFTANVECVGLIRNAPTGKWLSSDLTGASFDHQPDRVSPVHIPCAEERAGSANLAVVEQDDQNRPHVPSIKKNAIFIGHGKNTVPRDQLTKILDQLGIPYKLALDEASVGRPISTKVAETMQDCGAGILIFSADEEFKDVSGATIWRPRENVVHELGAASVLYGNRIVIFKEATVALASNFKDIGYIEYEHDNLIAKMSELLKELVAFDLVRLTVGG